MEKFAQSLRSALAVHANPVRAQAMAAYMKNHFVFFGVPTPARRAAVKPVLVQGGVGGMDGDALMAVAQALWLFDERECQYVAVDLLVTHAAHLQAGHEPALAALVRSRAWWDSVDLLATHAFGCLVRRTPALRARMRAYARHDDLWLRRVAILHQLAEGEATDRARLDTILRDNLGHPDFFIKKAMGWALRQFARTDADWVRTWLQAHAQEVSPLTRREALKRLG